MAANNMSFSVTDGPDDDSFIASKLDDKYQYE
jgi:hypothetical protein